jgi:hypothetical protein
MSGDQRYFPVDIRHSLAAVSSRHQQHYRREGDRFDTTQLEKRAGNSSKVTRKLQI